MLKVISKIRTQNTNILLNRNLWFVFLFLLNLAHASPSTFGQAKKIASTIFQLNPITLYCGCTYSKSKSINLQSCNMLTAGSIARAHRIEWEHMMPVENFGRHFSCWREPLCLSHGRSYKGRRCCQKIDKEFNQLEAELYNLWPAVGLVNQVRSNYRYSQLQSSETFYGCTIKIDKALKRIEPPDRAKGIVARANLFMSEYYKIKLSAQQKKLFLAWNHMYPPTPWEKEWALQVKAIEGYENPFIRDKVEPLLTKCDS